MLPEIIDPLATGFSCEIAQSNERIRAMRELTKEQIEQVAGAGVVATPYGSSSHDPNHGHHKHHRKHHHGHQSSYNPKPVHDPYAPVTPYAPVY